MNKIARYDNNLLTFHKKEVPTVLFNNSFIKWKSLICTDSFGKYEIIITGLEVSDTVLISYTIYG